MKFKNTQGISYIEIKPYATCFCPLGNDWYENEFTVKLVPYNLIPDYCDVDKFVFDNIAGKSLIIEDAVAKLYQYMVDEYKPLRLTVKSEVTNAGHSHVLVERASD